MSKRIDINDYYLGVILATPEYLNNPKRHRYFGDCDFDPFVNSTFFETVLFGVVTLLKKEEKDGEEYYVDQYYSRYKNELRYQLYKENSLGIILSHVKAFTDCYHEETNWYTQEEVLAKMYQEDDFTFQHTYYICTLKTGEENIVIINEMPMDAVQNEYYRELLGEEQFADIASSYEKMIQKSSSDNIEDSISFPMFVQYEWMRRQLCARNSNHSDVSKSLQKKNK